MSHVYYSHRIGVNENLKGLPLTDVIELFVRVFNQLSNEGYFSEAFGYGCVNGDIDGLIAGRSFRIR